MIITRAKRYWELCQSYCSMPSVQAKVNFIAFSIEPAINAEQDPVIRDRLAKIPSRLQFTEVA